VRIGELAAATGTTPRALRHYEQAGLIVSTRTDNGYRRYGAGAVTRVRNIRRLLGAGLTLDDVTAFLPCLDTEDVTAGGTSPKALAVARARLAVLESRIASQSAIRDTLAEALRGATASDARAPGAGRSADAGPSRAPASDVPPGCPRSPGRLRGRP